LILLSLKRQPSSFLRVSPIIISLSIFHFGFEYSEFTPNKLQQGTNGTLSKAISFGTGTLRPTMLRSTKNGTVGDCEASLHGMMSRGVSVVVAKSLMSIEARYEEAIARMDKKWNDKFEQVEAIFKQQSQQLKAMQEELAATKDELREARDESSGWCRNFQQKCTLIQQQSEDLAIEFKVAEEESRRNQAEGDRTMVDLKNEVEAVVGQMNQHHTVLAATKTDLESTFHVINDKTELLIMGFNKYAEELKEMREALDRVGAQADEFTKDGKANIRDIQTIMDQTLDLFNAKFEESVDLWTYQLEDVGRELEEQKSRSHVTVEDQEVLRVQLKAQLNDCTAKLDGLVRQMRHQSDELTTVKTYTAHVKRQRDRAWKAARAKSEILAHAVTEIDTTEIECVLDTVDCNARTVGTPKTAIEKVEKAQQVERGSGYKKCFVAESDEGEESDNLVFLGQQDIGA
jgi:hypothetical protein